MFRRDTYTPADGYRAAFPLGQASDLFRRMSRLSDFGYVDRVLYRRFLRLDGVSAKPDKVAQREVLATSSSARHGQTNPTISRQTRTINHRDQTHIKSTLPTC